MKISVPCLSLLALLAIACGGREVPSGNRVDSQSGARLKLQVVQTTGEDGLRLQGPSVIFDSDLDSVCAFGLAEDGKTRCLPTAAVDYVGYFLDAGCNESPAYSWLCSPAMKYAIRHATVDVCSADMPAAYFKAQEISLAPEMLYAKGGDGRCAMASGVDVHILSASWRFYRVGQHVAPESFVAGTAGPVNLN